MNTVFQVNNENNNLFVLKPNESFGVFKFGDSIKKYLNYKHTVANYDNSFVEYDFYEMGLCVWLDNESKQRIIGSVVSESYCYLNNQNIIGMSYKDFINKYNSVCDGVDVFYFDEIDQHTQRVYDHTSLGLQLWTWRNRTIAVIAYKVASDD